MGMIKRKIINAAGFFMGKFSLAALFYPEKPGKRSIAYE
jgi:hypothetical protein